MYDRTIQTFRTVLLIIGLVLLIVFGARAASQADSMKLAGGRTHHAVFAVATGTSVLRFLEDRATVTPALHVAVSPAVTPKAAPVRHSSLSGAGTAMPKTAVNPVSGRALPEVSQAPARLSHLIANGVPLGGPKDNKHDE